MQVREIMTENPACCSGELPVVDERGKPIGVVTDRDIACRGVAQGKRPETAVCEVMSSPVVTATPDTNLEDCCNTLEQNQVRRVPVVDENGSCCGMVSQADIAQYAPEHVAQIVRDVSRPTAEASRVGCC
jgi:CBS domain-containing protein